MRVLEASTEPPDGVVSLALDLVIEILLEAVRAEPNAVIDPGRRVLDVGQDGSSAWVTCETAADEEEPTRIEGSYVVGCDGSSSTVRNAVFGKDFPGYTWDPWLVAVNVRFQGSGAFCPEAGLSAINFIMHPTGWCFDRPDRCPGASLAKHIRG